MLVKILSFLGVKWVKTINEKKITFLVPHCLVKAIIVL